MKYRVTIDGQPREIDVTLAGDGTAQVTVDGEPVDADVTLVPGGASIRLGARVFDVLAGGPADAMTLAAGRLRATAAVEGGRARARRRGTAARGVTDKEVRSPMPGRIVKVLVAAGDAVEPGQPLVVVEAMKMENEVRATGPATIDRVHVTEGQSVESNAILLSYR